MYIRMNIRGVAQQLYLIESEIKYLDRIRQKINNNMQEAIIMCNEEAVSIYEECSRKLDELEKSFKNKRNFIENFTDDFQELSLEIENRLDESFRFINRL